MVYLHVLFLLLLHATIIDWLNPQNHALCTCTCMLCNICHRSKYITCNNLTEAIEGMSHPFMHMCKLLACVQCIITPSRCLKWQSLLTQNMHVHVYTCTCTSIFCWFHVVRTSLTFLTTIISQDNVHYIFCKFYWYMYIKTLCFQSVVP